MVNSVLDKNPPISIEVLLLGASAPLKKKTSFFAEQRALTQLQLFLYQKTMAGKKNDKGKDKAKESEKKGSSADDKKKKGGEGKPKAATSINVRHILVRIPIY